MKKLIYIFVLLCMFPALSYATTHSEFNPAMDIRKDGLSYDMIIFPFENDAGVPDEDLQKLYNEIIILCNEKGLYANLSNIEDDKIDKNQQNALSMKNDSIKKYDKAPTNLVLGGTLSQLEEVCNKQNTLSFTIYTVSIEIYIYSRKLKSIIYEANVKRKFDSRKMEKLKDENLKSVIFRNCVVSLLQSFIKKAVDGCELLNNCKKENAANCVTDIQCDDENDTTQDRCLEWKGNKYCAHFDCLNDIDCDDNNPNTKDFCIGNEEESHCSNMLEIKESIIENDE